LTHVVKNGKKVASSRGLEVVMRYHRDKSGIKDISAKGYYLYVKYSDGARVKSKFADSRVLKEWVAKKRMYLGLPYNKSDIVFDDRYKKRSK
jgi:hypothetical protein